MFSILSFRSRDSILRSVALLCTKTYPIWQSSLLSDVTVDQNTLLSLHECLERNSDDYSGLIKSLKHKQVKESSKADTEVLAAGERFASFSSLDSEAVGAAFGLKSRDGVQVVNQLTVVKLLSLQSLIIFLPNFIPQLQHRVDGKSVPLPLFTNSLERMFIEMGGELANCLSARNIVWIMTFCPTLRQAAFGFCVSSTKDFNFFPEFKSSSKGLSNVTQLALRIRFVFQKSNSKTWWGLSTEQSKEWLGGNKKTESIWNLLQTTKELSSLELVFQDEDRNPGDELDLHSSCLSALHQSFNTLKHIRMMNIIPDLTDLSSANHGLLQSLKIWSLELNLLFCLHRFNK